MARSLIFGSWDRGTHYLSHHWKVCTLRILHHHPQRRVVRLGGVKYARELGWKSLSAVIGLAASQQEEQLR
ncbi:hypothetical protein [Rubritalea tangerina]|uniref:hypothetical protein n=1 Tax=Rubritalea tangerina TaxID=430798 RepID=UPI003622A16D